MMSRVTAWTEFGVPTAVPGTPGRNGYGFPDPDDRY